MRYIVCLASAAATFLGPASAHGQQDWRHRREQECRKASLIVEKGRPEKKEAWAWELLPSCGADGARTFALVLRNSRSATDTLLLEQVIGRLDGWQDASLAAAASEIAGDESASVEARVYAVKFLLGTLRPGAMYTYGRLAAGLQVMKDEAGDLEFTSQCSASGFATHRNREGGTPLPGDHVPTVWSLLTGLAKDERVPPAVRNAAECVHASVAAP